MGWFIAGLVVLKALGIAFVVLLVARIVTAVRGRYDRAAEILRGRLAAGEITEDQYRRLQGVLQEARDS